MPVKNPSTGSGQASSQINPSQKKNFNAPGPTALSGTSPKYDKKKSECGFKIYIVVFGGPSAGGGAGFIVDFYYHKAGLVVEVDGDIHDLQQEEDAAPPALSPSGTFGGHPPIFAS